MAQGTRHPTGVLPTHEDTKFFDVGDRALLFLDFSQIDKTAFDKGRFDVSLYSFTAKGNCTGSQLLQQMYGPSGLSITQNNQSKYHYTNKPVDLTFYVYNRDLISEKKDFEFQVFTPNGKLSEKRQVQLQDCKRSSKVNWSFVPTIPGKYTFSATLSPNPAGSESFSGILIEDYVKPPLQQFKSGIPIDQIQCKQGLMLVKKHDNRPACIKSSSLSKLSFRRVVDCVWNCTISIPADLIKSDNSDASNNETKQKSADQNHALKRSITYDESSYLGKVGLSSNGIPKNPDGKINYDQFLYIIAKQKYTEIFEKNNISIKPNDIFLITGPSISMYTESGYACGYANANNQTFWLESRLNKDTLTELKIYNDNPDKCRPSYSSCFCEAQQHLAEQTHKQLSNFDESQANQVGKTIQRYFNEGGKIGNVPNSFVVGKYNLDLGAGTTAFCGQFKGKPHEWYFHGYIQAEKITEFSLDLDKKQELCTIKENPNVFTFDESAIVKDPSVGK